MQLRLVAGLALAASLLATTSSALAQAPGQAPPSPAQPAYGPDQGEGDLEATTEIRRYGHYILLADTAFLAATIATQKPELILSYFLTGPVVHVIHGNPGRALGSLVLRAGAPIAGAMIGAAIICSGDEEDNEHCGPVAVIIGGVAGMVAAAVIDAAAIARETVRKPPRVVPVASVTPDGAVRVGLGGHF